MTVNRSSNKSRADIEGASSPSSPAPQKSATNKTSNPIQSPVDLHAGRFECARLYIQNCFKAIEQVRDEKSFKSKSQNSFNANVLKERIVNLKPVHLEDLRSEAHEYGTTLINEERKSCAHLGKTILKLALGIIGYLAAAYFRQSLNLFSVMEDQPMKNIAVTLVQVTSGMAVILAIVDLWRAWKQRRRPNDKIESIEKVMKSFNDVLANAERESIERENQNRDQQNQSTATPFTLTFSPIVDLDNLAKRYENAQMG